uniref:Uncharacterized protein n=1 Tax=Oryza rufipogon TaxID=4529 RepID=A0A0E0R9N3_ORYRU
MTSGVYALYILLPYLEICILRSTAEFLLVCLEQRGPWGTRSTMGGSHIMVNYYTLLGHCFTFLGDDDDDDQWCCDDYEQHGEGRR